MPEQSTPLRYFRFSLRTLVVVMLMCVIAAIPCAWVGYSLNWIRERRNASDKFYVVVIYSANSYAPAGLWILGEKESAAIYQPNDRAEKGEHEATELRRLFPELDDNLRAPAS